MLLNLELTESLLLKDIDGTIATQLKIDQSYVRAIIAMAHNLGLDVIAEGVETKVQRQILLKNGCNHFQGILFGAPMPIGQFMTILKRD